MRQAALVALFASVATAGWAGGAEKAEAAKAQARTRLVRSWPEPMTVSGKQTMERGPLSDEHFTVDGTLVEAWARQKSFRRKGSKDEPRSEGPRNPTVNFHKEKRSNKTHESSTDKDSQLFRKGQGKEAKLSYMGTW
jgi:hypothetical protein